MEYEATYDKVIARIGIEEWNKRMEVLFNYLDSLENYGE